MKPDANGWFPIETAPKDSSRVILAWREVMIPDGEPEWVQTIGLWDHTFESVWDNEKNDAVNRAAWTDNTVASWGYEEYAELHPTHWRPLPKPPVSP